jgi:FKBP-type peptidyl-prolyl cis-trans isomerase FklB
MSVQNKLREFMEGKLTTEKQAGIDFMNENRNKPGIKELEGGIQYQILREGSGKQPSINDKVKAHYKGSLLNGTEFDSSFKRGQPFTAPLKALIKGWQIALPLMKEGSEWILWIPSDLAYGDRTQGHGPTAIPGGATLIFEIHLIEVVK